MRINLSEQTDMMDLLGADLPSASGTAGEFAWSDGPLLGALKAGHWVLLDELNLAGNYPQSPPTPPQPYPLSMRSKRHKPGISELGRPPAKFYAFSHLGCSAF